jgi:rhodanese-related sulfurtransferase
MEYPELLKQYYSMENAVLVSPHGLRKRMDAGDSSFILVDLRSHEEFLKGRIKGALNIPAYRDPDTAAYDEHERIISAFKDLPSGQEIILYCYSKYCMTGRKIGKLLADNGILAKHLNIGWNEWRHSWNQWNHEHEWELVQVSDYIEEDGTRTEPVVSCLC